MWSCHPYADIDDPKNSGHDNTASMVKHLGATWHYPNIFLGESGTREEATGEDRSAHRLRAIQADDEGTPLLAREQSARSREVPGGGSRPVQHPAATEPLAALG